MDERVEPKTAILCLLFAGRLIQVELVLTVEAAEAAILLLFRDHDSGYK